jgi:hypothetical protein
MKPMIVVLLAILAALALAAPGHAGTYDVWSCAGPAGEPLPLVGWTAQERGGVVASSCGSRGGAFSGRLGDGQVPSGSFARWTFDTPANTTIARVTIHRVANAASLNGTWWRTYFLFRDAPVIAEGYGLDVCVYLSGPCKMPGDPAAPLSDASRYSSPPITAGRLVASAQCDGAQPCAPRPLGSTGAFTIYRARITIADAFPPVFRRPPAGSLLATSTDLAGERSVSFDGTDLGGGLRAAEVIVDGLPVARTPIAEITTCTEPYWHPVPCPGAAAGTVSVDTATLENGRHRVQVALVDAANNRTLSDPVSVSVRNDKQPNGTHASRVAKLTASFRLRGGRRALERRIAFRRRAVVAGRLVNGARQPIAGAELRVLSRIDRLGAREREIAAITTDSEGRFRWRTPRGPSRYLRITYRAYRSDEQESASTELKLSVRPAIALRVRPDRVRNGGSVAFKGRLIGGPGRAATPVVLEAVGRNVRRRVPVATLSTDSGGRFRFRYRFLRSFAPFTYRFRARVIPQASYPYAGGSSRVVIVRIVR